MVFKKKASFFIFVIKKQMNWKNSKSISNIQGLPELEQSGLSVNE